MVRRFLRFTAVSSAVAMSMSLFAATASAHTISVGSFNAGAPGSVSIVLGTYDHGGPIAQGTIQLIAGPTSPSAVTPFTTVLLSKPAGLIDGTNNFYADAMGGGQWGTLPSDSYSQATNLLGLGPVVNWMSATFTGLSAGLYTYQLSGLTSANWTNVNSFLTNWTGTLVIPESSTQGAEVPEPATLTMLGMGLAGMVARRRRQVKK